MDRLQHELRAHVPGCVDDGARLFRRADLRRRRPPNASEWEASCPWTRSTMRRYMTLAADCACRARKVTTKDHLRNEHLRDEGVRLQPDGFKQPRPPYLIDGVSPRSSLPRPTRRHTGAIEARHAGHVAEQCESSLPFEGMRSSTSRRGGPPFRHSLLSLLGAEVGT